MGDLRRLNAFFVEVVLRVEITCFLDVVLVGECGGIDVEMFAKSCSFLAGMRFLVIV
jgi:hypothetical protein